MIAFCLHSYIPSFEFFDILNQAFIINANLHSQNKRNTWPSLIIAKTQHAKNVQSLSKSHIPKPVQSIGVPGIRVVHICPSPLQATGLPLRQLGQEKRIYPLACGAPL